MIFINDPVDTTVLPDVTSVELRPVQKNFFTVLVLQWGIITLVLSAIAILAILFIPGMLSFNNWLGPVLGLALVLGLYYFFLNQSFPYLKYAVRERDIIAQRGWIKRSVRVCPFNRVQNCTVQSGPLERRFGLASLIVYTAGANSADLHLSGLLQEEADRLRHFILEKIHSEGDEGI